VFLQSSFHFVSNINYAATSDTSKISTEMMVDNDPLLDMDVNYAAPSDSPVYVGTIQSFKNEKTTHDVSFELNNEVEEPIFISSPISTEILVDDKPLLDIDATPNTCNKEVNIKPVDHCSISRIVAIRKLLLSTRLFCRREMKQGSAFCVFLHSHASIVSIGNTLPC
jgi:hypothetical protein